MSDRLTLKGYKDLTKQTGSEFAWIQPLKGGDFHMFPRWWNKKGTVQYEAVTILRVSRPQGDIDVIIPTSINTHLDILWDDVTENFKFPIHRGIERIGIFNAGTTTLVQEYQFSRIAGGAALKRTITSLPDRTIGTATITGNATPAVGIGSTYSAAIDGNANDAVYSWSTDDGAATITALPPSAAEIVFSEAGTFDVTVTVTSALSTDSPVTEVFSVTAS